MCIPCSSISKELLDSIPCSSIAKGVVGQNNAPMLPTSQQGGVAHHNGLMCSSSQQGGVGQHLCVLHLSRVVLLSTT
jgi:hypothetical protein